MFLTIYYQFQTTPIKRSYFIYYTFPSILLLDTAPLPSLSIERTKYEYYEIGKQCIERKKELGIGIMVMDSYNHASYT